MSEITLIGIDLAKNIFRINCLDENGKRVMNKNLHRESIIQFFAPMSECTVAMEACASSHYWGRTIESLGHTVKLVHPHYVTPYRLGDKNDANDAAAICAAALRPDMRFVRLRSQRQSDVQALHRVREGLVTEKTATSNRVRALLAENGIVIKQGPANVIARLPAIVDDADNELSSLMRQLLRGQYAHLLGIRDRLAELEVMLKSLVAEEESYKRLMEIPGVGLITATLLGSELGNGSAFRNGRCFAASLGLVPRQFSSGGKNTLLGINKRGNRYLRTLLIHCARAVLRSFALGKSPFGEGALDQWVRNLLERRGKNKTAVALAAKLARVAWAMLSKGTNFQKAVTAAA
jgi:transposase